MEAEKPELGMKLTLIPTKRIIEGFDKDLKDVIATYLEKSPDVRLRVFFTFWNENCLDCLFANRYDPRELLEAITEMNKILVSELVNQQNSLEFRTGVLYFVLCLFQKQPERLRRRIRLECADTIKVGKLALEITDLKGHSDAVFAWKKLKSENAIDIVEYRTIYGPSMLNKRSGSAYGNNTIRNTQLHDAERSVLDFLAEKVEQPLDELTDLCRNYDSMRNVFDRDEFSHEVIKVHDKRPLSDFIDRARSIIEQYKKGMNS